MTPPIFAAIVNLPTYYQMNVKLVILKSLEDVIAEVKEVFVLDKVVSYILTDPYVVSLNEAGDKIGFYPYAPLSKDTVVTIPTDWVVTVLEPKDEIKQSYEQRLNAKPENSDTQE